MKYGSTHSTARRRWMKKGLLSAGAAAVVTPFLPTQWQKPLINTVLLPAHAQTSPGSGGSGGGGNPLTLSDPCTVELVSGDPTTATVEIRVSGTVIPAAGGESIVITAEATPTGSTAGPVTVVTATDGTYVSGVISLAGPGVTLVDVTSTLGSSTATCQLDVVASSGGSGSGGVA